ncbi:MAG: hypothetical protein CMI02_17265 [Oceanospirillaceae bacterium]|nr:hypothetical protein [Oceanospirillum sp.]MBT11116.1 hypothetical protein [Oceanospirillaceae bacterium]MBT13774.1 hypothetical protein [Oceanospirillaceae bacterium]|tara:strand:- start:5742 stop:6287 length:546 start_codon:yes stop_codon:yes gene_type:complete
MQLTGSIALLLMSGLLLWSSRPGRSWSGAGSARFAAALIMLVQAVLSLVPLDMPYSLRLLPQQLSLYAALPLLITTLITAALGFHWSRLIWGRLLLALCVVFEIARRINELHTWLLIALGVAFVAAVLHLKSDKKNSPLAIVSWALLFVWYYQTGLAQNDLNLWLAATIVPSLYLHRAGTR